MWRNILLVVALIAVLLLGSYYYLTHKKPVLDDRAREATSGSYIRLSRGVVHYELAGPPEGRVVVLVHGLTTPYFIWDKTFPALVDAGYRVLRYDHYGRGFSDRPFVAYGHDLYDAQLLELLQALQLETPVHLVGLSMGGAVAVTFSARHPEMVAKVCLISPMSFPIEEPFVRKLATVPLLGEYIMALGGEGIIKNGVADSLYRFERFPEFMGKFEEQLQYRGYGRAILSTLRNMTYAPLSEAFQQVGRQDRPLMMIWGRQDAVLPFALTDKVRAAMPGIEFHALDAAGHSSQYEQPEVVNPLIVDFLGR